MADISNVVNVSISQGGELLQSPNANACMIITDENSHLDNNNRYEIYKNINSVEQDFGTNSKAYGFAKTFFSQAPNPVNAGGYLAIGYWRSEEETVPATAGYLYGGSIDESVVLPQIQQISDGSFSITVDDGGVLAVDSLDFRTVTTMQDVADIIANAVNGTVVVYGGSYIRIVSQTTGATSKISYLTEESSGAGTYIGDLLALSLGSGAMATDGQAAQKLDAETQETAIAKLYSQVYFRAFVMIDDLADAEYYSIGEWCQANDVIMYSVFKDSNNLNVDVNNAVWKIKLGGLINYRCLYDKTSNRKMAAAYMARMHSVNLDAENSAITMNIKELTGIKPLSYSQTEITKAKTVGLDLYTTMNGSVSVLLTSGANDYADNVYNIIALKKDMQTALFNILKGASTKIAQTVSGLNQLVSTVEDVCDKYANANVIAPGTWNSPDTFGDIGVFNRNIEQAGYYVKAGSLEDQSQSDREARKSPVLQCAIKLSGAFHSVDLIVNVNL